jgi:uncharacterized protein (DUF2164 family)
VVKIVALLAVYQAVNIRSERMTKQDLINRITDYLASGGLFNPELMDSEKVQRLLIDVRDYLLQEKDNTVPYIPSIPYGPINTHCPTCGLKLDQVMGYYCSNPTCPTGLA